MRLSGTKTNSIHQYRGLGDQLWDISGTRPSLDLRFADSKSLVDATTGQNLVTFTRSSSGTYVGSNGVLQTATTNEPRFDHNPTTGESLGLLVEESRANVALQSQDFATTWATTSASVSTNTTTAPDGTLTADTITASSSTLGRVQQTITFTGDGDKAISVWLKAGTAPTSVIKIDDSTAGFVNRLLLTVTWTNGVASVLASNGTLQGIDAFPNGWFRIRGLAVGVVAANTNRYRIEADSTNGTGTVIAWGAQAENGSFTTSYIPTTTATATRSADVASITGTNFSSWYQENTGTFFAAANSLNIDTNQRGVFGLDQNAFARGYAVSSVSATGNRLRTVRRDPVNSITVGNDALSTLSGRVAAYFNSAETVVSVNGAATNSNTTALTLSPMTDLRIGWQNIVGTTTNNYLCGCISRLTYWPARLANTTLQDITQ